MTPTNKFVLGTLACCLLGGAAQADIDVKQLPKPSTGYRKTFALIVGIDYKDREPALGSIPPLQRAEADAAAVHKVLKDCYGYDSTAPDEVVLLTGKAATKAEIEKLLYTGCWCDKEKVGPEDSVLFFFSGHGWLHQTGDKSHGYLLPADIRFKKDGKPELSSAVDITDMLVRKLGAECYARHKLIVLDCCHSGAVFRFGLGAPESRTADTRLDEDTFKAKAFQAIAASRENQQASDGDGGGNNSPFTELLVNSLLYRLPQKTPTAVAFPATAVFGEIKLNMSGTRLRQTPECRQLTDDIGEFHFVIAADPKFPPPLKSADLKEIDQRVVMASIPSTFGNWWADEFLWFMPSIRYELIKNQPNMKDIDFDPGLLKKEARRLAAAGLNARHSHLKLLLDADRTGDHEAAFRKVVIELNAATGEPLGKHPCCDPSKSEKPCDSTAENKFKSSEQDKAMDLHYLAVICQKQGRISEARTCYKGALDEYEIQVAKRTDLLAMYALCRLDYGILCLRGLGDYSSAIDQFGQAQQTFPAGADRARASFKLFTICQEADAYRRLGQFGQATRQMQSARDLMYESLDPKQERPLSASFWKQQAWAFMEQCRFKEAAAAFVQSRAILHKNRQNSPYQRQCELFHIAHGLALIERFQGQDMASLAKFRDLTAQIFDTIRQLERDQSDVPNFTELRQLLYERYMNSLDRQADCSLFSRTHANYPEAADDYRRATMAALNTTPARRDQMMIDLLYRQAVTLSLPSPARDIELAAHLCRKADEKARNLPKGSLPEKTALIKSIAGTLIARTGEAGSLPPDVRKSDMLAGTPRKVGGPGDSDALTVASWLMDYLLKRMVKAPDPTDTLPAGGDCLLSTLEKYDADSMSRLLDRDEVERLMFANKLLIQNWDAWGLERFKVRKRCFHLLYLCRMASQYACTTQGSDIEFLSYLREYYDVAFLAMAAPPRPADTTLGKTAAPVPPLPPVPVKQLIEIAWEATNGVHYLKPKEVAPTIVMYHAGGRAHLLIDIPPGAHGQGVGRCVVMAKELSEPEVLNQAAQSGNPLPLPDEMRSALTAMSSKQTLVVRWRDPILGIGTAPDTSSNSGPSTDDPHQNIPPPSPKVPEIPNGQPLKLAPTDGPFKVSVQTRAASHPQRFPFDLNSLVGPTRWIDAPNVSQPDYGGTINSASGGQGKSSSMKPNALPPYGGPGVAIVLPAATGGSLTYVLDGATVQEIKAGNRHSVRSKPKFIIEFDRGGNFGTAKYELKEGVYEFIVGEKGWDVVLTKEDPTAAPTPTQIKRNSLPSAPGLATPEPAPAVEVSQTGSR